MRILTQCYEFPPIGGGGAKVVFGLLKHLTAKNYEIDLVTMGFRGLPRTEQFNGIRVHRVPCLRVRDSICSSPEMASYIVSAIPIVVRMIKERQYDINHTHFVFPDGLIALLLKKITGLPYIITVHGSDVPGYNPDRFKNHHRILSPLWKRVVQSANLIVSPSETLKSLVLSKCPTVPVRLIPNGLNTQQFRPDQKKEDRILVVSRMFERKGIQYFLKALAEINADTSYEVNIVGEGPFLPSLRKMSAQVRMAINFWGHLNYDSPQLKYLFESSRIFVFPSESENFPNVLLEAMSAGLAIISTKKTGCAEVVGDAGVLVPIRDSRAIQAQLERLMADPWLCERLGKEARQRLEQNFTWDVVGEKYQKVYEQAVAATPR